jgi:hypothetical protein
MVELKTPGEIDAMAAAGAVVARALAATRDATGSGVRLTELDQVAREGFARGWSELALPRLSAVLCPQSVPGCGVPVCQRCRAARHPHPLQASRR